MALGGRLVKVFASLLGALLLLFLLAPLLLREVIEWQATERADLELELKLEDIDLDPIAGSIALHGIEIRARAENLQRRAENLQRRAENLQRSDDPSVLRGMAATPNGSKESKPLRDADQSACWLCIERVVIDLAWSSLWENPLRLDSITVVEPRLRLVRQSEGDLELPEFVEADGEQQGTSDHPESESEATPALLVDRLSIEGGALSFLDLTLESRSPITFEIDEIRLHRFAMGRSADYASPARLTLEASVAGSPVSLGASWRARPQGLMARGRFEVDGLHLSRARAYLADAGFRGLEGELDLALEVNSRRDARDSALLDLSLRDASIDWRRVAAEPETSTGNTQEALALSLSALDLTAQLGARNIEGLADPDATHAGIAGTLEITEFAAIDTEPPRFEVSWSGLSMKLAERGPSNVEDRPASPSAPPAIGNRLIFDSVTLDSPVVRVAYGANGLILPWREKSEIAEEVEVPLEIESPPAEEFPRIELSSVRVSNGRIEIKDRRIEPFVRVDIEEIVVEADGIEWPGGQAEELRVEAVPRHGERIEIEASAALPDWEAELRTARIALEPFNPYLDRYAGYSATQGELSLDSEVASRGGEIAITSRVTLHELDLQDSDRDHDFRSRFGVPLGIGLALLRDRADEIALDLDFEISRDGQLLVDLAPAIRQALGRAIVNAISTPLRVFGSLQRAPSSVEDFDALTVSFDRGRAQLDPEDEKILEAIADQMVAHPRLALTLVGQSNPDESQDLEIGTSMLDLDNAENVAAKNVTAKNDGIENARTGAQTDNAARLARERIDRVCRFFREVRGLSADRFFIQPLARVGPELDPGVGVSLDVMPSEPANSEARVHCATS